MKFLNSVYLKDVSKLGLDTTNTVATVSSGEMVWNQEDGTLNLGLYNGVTLQQGQEIHVYGKASGTIANGDVVQFAGAQGDHIRIKKAVGSEIKVNPHLIIGIATQAFTNTQYGYVTWFGKIHDLNTNTYPAGTILYFDCETSALINTVPVAPNPTITMCAVLRQHGTEGSILVRPEWGYRIDQLNDVHIDDIQDGQLLLWNTEDSRWENGNLNITAANVSIVDADGYFISTDVENSLKETGALLANALYATGTDPETGELIPVDSDTLQGSTWSAVEESIIPSTTGLNLGSADHPWNHLYVADSSLYIGNLKLSTDTGALVVADATTGDPVPVATSTLPIATESSLGIVKVDGTTITIDEDGVLSGASTYSLPTASTSVLGGVKVDGTKITIDGNGVITTGSTIYDQSLNTTDDVSFDVVTANSYVSTGTGTPTVTSSTNIDLTAANAVRIRSSPLRLASFTTTNRDLLTPVNGDMIYNSTLGVVQEYEGSAWVTKASTDSPTFTGAVSGITKSMVGLGNVDNNSTLAILQLVYPIGAIYISVSSTSPATLFGFGTWVAFAAGRTLVGIDATQTEFDTVEEIGGAKTHKLTVSEMPSHSHNLPIHSVAGTGTYLTSTSGYSDNIRTHGEGGDQPHNNLQPYIVTYMWKRTA